MERRERRSYTSTPYRRQHKHKDSYASIVATARGLGNAAAGSRGRATAVDFDVASMTMEVARAEEAMGAPTTTTTTTKAAASGTAKTALGATISLLSTTMQCGAQKLGKVFAWLETKAQAQLEAWDEERTALDGGGFGSGREGWFVLYDDEDDGDFERNEFESEGLAWGMGTRGDDRVEFCGGGSDDDEEENEEDDDDDGEEDDYIDVKDEPMYSMARERELHAQ